MGSWTCYNHTLGPGERDTEDVAAELRAALPGVLETALGEYTDVEDVIYGAGPAVWVDDGVVHWSTGENHSVSYDFWNGLVPALDVHAAWACGVWRMEAEYYGGVEVFAWVDGGFVPVDARTGKLGADAEDALGYAEREWGVTGWPDTHPDRGATDHDRVEEPGDPAPVAPVGLATTVDVERGDAGALRSALADDDPGRRRAAVEELYRHLSQGWTTLGVVPELADVLDDGATRLVAGAAVRELSPGTDDLGAGLTDDDPARRRAAAECCLLVDVEAMPDDALAEALSDDDADVRAAAGRALRYPAMDEYAAVPTEATDALVAATGDDDPRVRVHATVGAALFAFQHDAGRVEAAADALVDATTDEPFVREQATEYARHANHAVVGAVPEDARPRLLVRSVEAGSAVDGPSPGRVLATHAARYNREAVEPVLDDLVALGWGEDASALAREVVATAVDRHDLSVPREPLVDALAAGVAVEETVELLGDSTAGHDEGVTGAESEAVAGAVAALRDGVATGDSDACDALVDLVATDVATDDAAVGDAVPALREGLAGESASAAARAAIELRVAGGDVPDDLVADATAVLVDALATPDGDRRRAVGATLGRLSEAAPDVAPSFAGALAHGDPEDGDWEPLVDVAMADPEAVAEPLVAQCRAVAARHGDDESDPTYEVAGVVEAVAEDVPAALAPATPAMATILDVVGRGYRGRFAGALAAAARADPEPLADDGDSVARLSHHLGDVKRETRTAVAGALSATAEAGATLPPVARPLAGSSPEAAAWPLGVVATGAPVFARRAVRNATASIDRGKPEESGWLFAEVAHAAPEAVVGAKHARSPVDRLTERLRGPRGGRVARAFAGFAAEAPGLVPEETVTALVALVADGADASRPALVALSSVAEDDPERVGEPLEARVDDPADRLREVSDPLVGDDLDQLLAALDLDDA